MTTKQKAKAWDIFKKAANDLANSRDWFTSREAKEAARAVFNSMCEAEMHACALVPDDGEEG